MEKLKKKRSVLRTSFTKTLNILKAAVDKTVSEIELGTLKDKLTKIEETIKDLKSADESIVDFLINSEAAEDEINAEMEESEKYSDEYIFIKRCIGETIQSSLTHNSQLRGKEGSTSDATALSGVLKNKHYKLPKLNIAEYDGSLINYLSFWSQFKKIHTDKELEDCDKFQYLLQSIKSGTRAKELLESYPLTSENYVIAVKAFQERYGKKELLVEVYVRELLKLIISNVRANGKDRLPLPDLFMKVEAYLRSLESMGLDAEANSAWLYPMVESSLPDEILRAWQRSPFASMVSTQSSADSENNAETKGSNLSRLMQFLKREVEGEERLQLARTSFEKSYVKEFSKDKYRNRDPKIPTAAGLFSGKESCIFCNKNHNSKDCFSARSWSLKDKIIKIQEKKCCLKCLKFGHIAKACKVFLKCHVCSKAHVELLCPELCNKDVVIKPNPTDVVQSTVANSECSHEVALMTIQVNIEGNKTKRVRALLDCGSQRSYILESTAKELGLKPCGTENLAHTLFGGAHTEVKPHNKFRLRLYKPDSHFPLEFEFLDQEIICGNIPRVPKNDLLKELKKHRIWLSDIGQGCPKVELLIGSDIYGQILTGKVKQLQGGLTAIHTRLGWAVCGQINHSPQSEFSNSTSMLTTNLVLKDMKVPDLWKLETIGILDPGETLLKAEEEEMAQEHFLSKLKRNGEGRYCVSLPWKSGKIEIPSNRNISEKRLFSATKRLKISGNYNDYNKIFEEWEEEGIIEKVPNIELENTCHYLPHHPVIKLESATTKIRPVFDASCKVERSPSLNDCLVTGPNLIEQIPSMLLRFREKPIGVTADIKKAFLQIEVQKEDRDYLRFLWWEKDNQIKVFRHKRVVFGVKSSPFLLGAVLKFHFDNAPEGLKDIAEKLSKSFYVDNCITSVNNVDELNDFMLKSTELLAEAKMDLRLWEFGPNSEFNNKINNKIDLVSVLGLYWDQSDDSLKIAHKFESINTCPSKRDILSITQSIFDPIGILSPVLLSAKLLIQEAWASKSNWDDPLPENLRESFKKWYNELSVISNLRFPRRVGFGNKDSWTIHVFCDASLNSYATVIFLRCEDFNRISVQLLSAKSRISPLKKMTIPRLELLACILGARLSRFILEALDLPSSALNFYSDSSTALAWIQRNDQWGTFVGNRVKEICRSTDPRQWYFIPGSQNPADLPSRGCSAKQLLCSRWWEGPEWLRNPRITWPSAKPSFNENEIVSEKRSTVLANVEVISQNPKWFEKFSKFSRIVRVLAWIRRFINNCRGKKKLNDITLSAVELQEAENTLWHIVQKESFPNGKTTSISGLIIFVDETGLIRLKTKIVERDDEFTFKYPILLPSKHHVTKCLVTEYHLKNCHAGIQVLASKLREKYWIISSKRVIRSIVTKCVRCKRFTSKAQNTAPIHLPLDRVRDANVFEITGVDLCGPLHLRNKKKAWIVLFTCAVYRAIHLECVTSLSSEAFICALRKFIARRGRPSKIYSDNGTNFTGTYNLLKDLDWSKIQSAEMLSPIKWKFIPPTAAWWGGWWERLVRSVKTLLVRVLGRSSVTYEELYTILCDIEATINSRPLTYISDGSNEFSPLTPSMFLQDIPVVGVADLDNIDNKRLQIRYSYCQQLRQELRSRFRREYLGQLVQRSGEKGLNESSIQVNDIVLVGLDNQKRLNWPMARVMKIFPSRDGKARVAELKTNSGTLIRPLQKLYSLEVMSADDPVILQKRSKRGRLLKPPQRLTL